MNRTRASSLDAFGTRNQRNRIFPALEASDGSTLSLDFTQMSSLDSRFTFTRNTSPGTFSTLATFINSQGYVQFDDHNLVRNSTFSSLTGWAPTGSGTTTNASGVLTLSTSAGQTGLYYAQTNGNGFQDNAPRSGRVYSASIQVSSISGGMSYQEVITVGGTISNTAHYLNGTFVESGATATTGLITIVWTSGGANTLRIGIGASGSGNYPSASISMTLPRCVIGSQLHPIYFESSVDNTYHAPRFEYDPNTLTPRGLLMECTTTNLLCWSESFATSGGSTNWGYNSNTGTVVSTTNPANGSTAFQFAETTNSGPLQQSVTATNAVHTFSAWFKASIYNNVTTTQVQFGLFTTGFVAGTASIVSGPGSASVASNVVTLSGLSTTQWTRVQLTTSAALPAGAVAILIYPNTTGSETPNASFYIWGAQIEAGSGASSYIPTGSSNVTRAVDKLSMTDISLMGWNQTAGTFLWNMDVQSESNTTSFPAFAGMYRAGPVRVMRFQLNNSSGTNPRIGGDTWTATPSSIVTGAFYTRPVATTFKAAVAFANTGQSMTYCINGTVQSTATGTGTLATPTLFLMHQDPSAADTEYFPIHLRQLKYWPTNLSSSDLRSITL